MNRTKMMLSAQMEKEFEWTKWTKEIPALNFDSKWKVKVIPPFVGAVVRFWIEHNDQNVSVYLDCYNQLGNFGAPYWELYPAADGENERYAMNDTAELMKAIRLSLRKPSKVKAKRA